MLLRDEMVDCETEMDDEMKEEIVRKLSHSTISFISQSTISSHPYQVFENVKILLDQSN